MKRYTVRSVLLFLLLLGVTTYLVKYFVDQRWVGQLARQIVPRDTPDSIAAVKLSAYVRQHIRFENAPYDHRPFLRASAREALTTGLGYCGEATRSYIALARSLGLKAQRVNLHGRVVSHVVPEVELSPGRWVLIDIQQNPVTNRLLDPHMRTVDELLGYPDSPFQEYSNINLRRLPVLNHFVRRIQLNSTLLTWILENPALLKAWLLGLFVALIVIFSLVDRVLMRWYAHRLRAHADIPVLETV